jgi:hypothetical protein
MPPPPADERPRGLPSLAKSKEDRVAGKVRYPSTKFWGWAAIVLAVTAIVHWKRTQGEIESTRSTLLAKQRTVVTELGPRWLPLREKIERWSTELAKEPGAEVVEKDILATWKFLDKPGIYLRLDLEQAASPDTLRKAANDSLRDGFTACLFRAENKSQLAGKECKRTRECALGEICNELDRCAPPAQPYNLRVAYRSLRVLSDDFIRDVQEASGELELRKFVLFYEDAVQDDIPIAIDLLERAQYFTLVLDEPVANLAVPQGSTKSEALRSVAHSSRVGIWRLSDGKLVLRVRRAPDVDIKQSGAPVDERVMLAQKRQALSCALAGAVRDAMGDSESGLEKKQ